MGYDISKIKGGKLPEDFNLPVNIKNNTEGVDGIMPFDIKPKSYDKAVTIDLNDGLQKDETEAIILAIDDNENGEITSEELENFANSNQWGLSGTEALEAIVSQTSEYMADIEAVEENKMTETAEESIETNATDEVEEKSESTDDTDAVQSNEQGDVQSVTVDTWGTGSNDCLDHIMKNNYPDITPYSDEWFELETKIMDANPEIYGGIDTEGNEIAGRNRLNDKRHSAVIQAGDTIKLPGLSSGQEEVDDINETAEVDDNDKSVSEYDANENYVPIEESNAEAPETETETLTQQTEAQSELELRSELATARALTLHAAMDGAGTREKTVSDIVNNVKGQDLVDVMNEYEALFGETLEKAISDDFSFLSGQDRLLSKLDSAAAYAEYAKREEISKEDVLQAKLTALKAATSDHLGTDEKVLNNIIANMSSTELNEFIQYCKNNGVDVTSVVKAETSFENKKMLLEKIEHANPDKTFNNDISASTNSGENARTEEQLREQIAITRAQALHAAMDRAGTKEDIVSDIVNNVKGQDLVDVMNEYEALFGETLEKAISDDFSFLSGQDRLLSKLDSAAAYAEYAKREEVTEEKLRTIQLQAFKTATVDRLGTDEKIVYQMLQNGSMSNADIMALNNALVADGTSLVKIIKDEFMGDDLNNSTMNALLDTLKRLGIE